MFVDAIFDLTFVPSPQTSTFEKPEVWVSTSVPKQQQSKFLKSGGLVKSENTLQKAAADTSDFLLLKNMDFAGFFVESSQQWRSEFRFLAQHGFARTRFIPER